MTITSSHRLAIRKLFTWLALIAGLAILSQQAGILTTEKFMAIDDYLEYWAAGRLNAIGQNPYDPDQMAEMQTLSGRTENLPVMMWNPPWVLALIMPFGLIDYPLSRLLWLLLNIATIFVSADWTWRHYGGSVKFRWLAWMAGFSFASSLDVLRTGQSGALLLLGAVGFLYFIEREKPWLAGAFVVLTTVKPHLLYLLFIALFLWSIQRRKWPVLAGAAVTLACAAAIAMIPNSSLFSQYLYAATHYPPIDWVTPTLGGILRLALGPEKTWLQLLPPLFGLVWFLIYWKLNHRSWVWSEKLPLLILVSTVTAAYGWTSDQTVFLAAILPVMAWVFLDDWSWSKSALVAAYLALNGLALALSMEQQWFWWLGLSYLAWYLAGSYFMKNHPAGDISPQLLKRHETIASE